MNAVAIPLVEVWRGPILESLHRGHAMICDARGGIVEAWGDPQAVIYPRSSAKMIQALPLAESGLALEPHRLALACASHRGAPLHVAEVSSWLAALGASEDDLRCGPEASRDPAFAAEMIRQGAVPRRVHNNCSGKHTGFLALARHLQAGPDYLQIDHPVQKAVLRAFEELTGETSPGHGIDGCSAPNFATTLHGLARAMAAFAVAGRGSGGRARAMERLVEAMAAHPVLLAGEGAACTELIRALKGRAVVKTGAEGVYVAILPGQGLGVALKIADGATRASEAVIAALLVRLGLLEAAHPAVASRVAAPVTSRMGENVGQVCPVPGLMDRHRT